MQETALAHHEPDLPSYDHIIVAFSGGKDSLACVLHLLELGVPADKIELHHHLVDGGGGTALMDWPVTEAYCAAVAQALEMPLLRSWRCGGFLREMTRDNQPTASIMFERLDGTLTEVGGNGPKGTRLRFPQVSADLSVRYCSAYLKIDVCDALIRNDDRFRGTRTLVVTGERAEESSARARYAVFEPHRADLRDGRRYQRHVDAWRPVHGWSREQVWAIIQRHGIIPHPAYYIGWGRLSCLCCIFGSPDQWASIKAIAPWEFDRIAQYERQFGTTIHRTESVVARAAKGKPYAAIEANPDHVSTCLDMAFYAPVRCNPADWLMPAGAFGENTGPT